MLTICGDCIEEMKKFPENHFDLIVADPPYGGLVDAHWDRIPDYFAFSERWLLECKRVLKDDGSIYVWCSIGQKSTSLLDIAKILKDEFVFQDMIVWSKQRGRGNRKGWLFTREEILWASKTEQYRWNLDHQYSSEKYEESWLKRFEREARINNRPFRPYKRATNVWKDIPEITIEKVKQSGTKGQRATLHPNQKPFRAIERIVLAHTQEGDLVLDPFAGSGTTGVVCKEHKRDFVLIERDEEYFLSLNRRLNENEHRRSDESPDPRRS